MTIVRKLSSRSAATGHPFDWRKVSHLPGWCAEILESLTFAAARRRPSLDREQWNAALDFCDRQRLTLLAAEGWQQPLPDWVASRLERNRAANRARLVKLQNEYKTIAKALDDRGLKHILLKGFLQAPDFVPDAALRMQFDLDLLLPRDQVLKARQAVMELGFESVEGLDRLPTDHLAPLVRKTGWEWKGDYFDPDIPPVVELHFQLWDADTERFGVEGLEAFWSRQARRRFEGGEAPTLSPVDQLGYAALHAVRHLLRADLKVSHVWELGYFLDTHRHDAAFWRLWQRSHSHSLRRAETLAFALARQWFGCRLSKTLVPEIDALPADWRLWLETYAATPLTRLFRPGKSELWLHLSMISGVRDRLHVVRRRLLPLTLPGPVSGVFLPEKQKTFLRRAASWAGYARFLAIRAVFHLRALASAAWGGFEWWRRRRAGSPSAPSPERK